VVAFDHELAIRSSRRGRHYADLRHAGGDAIERKPRVCDRMRFDRDHFAACADMARQRYCVSADIGADIDEHAAPRRVRAQKIQFLAVVFRVEQRATFSGARLMIKTKAPALILRIDGSGAQQVDQPRH